MEPQGLSTTASAQAILALCAIPVVVLALWAEYFNRGADERSQEDGYEVDHDIESVRIAGVMTFVVEFMIFLSTAELREKTAGIGHLIFLGTILVVLGVQFSIERKYEALRFRLNETKREKEQTAIENIGGVVLKTIMTWVFGLSIQIAILFLFVRLGVVLAQGLGATENTTGFFAVGVGILGIAAGLVFNYSLAPFYMKWILPNSSDLDQEVQELTKGCIQRAGILSPDLRVIELSHYKITGIIWVGLHAGKGFFKPILFLSRWMFSALKPAELEAVILNRIIHLRLNHPRNKFFTTLGLILLTSALAFGTVWGAQFFLPKAVASNVIGPIAALVSFFFCFKSISDKSKSQETEGDIMTVKKLGVPLKTLVSALVKIDQNVYSYPDEPFLIHPETLERINALRSAFPEESEVVTLESLTNPSSLEENQNPSTSNSEKSDDDESDNNSSRAA